VSPSLSPPPASTGPARPDQRPGTGDRAEATSTHSHHRARRIALALATLLLATAPGCADLQRLATTALDRSTLSRGGIANPIPPRVTVADVRLTEAPTNEMLAAYYCAQVAGPFVCGLLGRVPAREEIRFVFAVDLDVRNANAFPLPLVEVLSAFTAYPQATGRQNLGAVCLSLCESGDCPQNSAQACRSSQSDIRTMDDFARAAVGFLIAVADGRERFENLRVRTIAPNGQTRATIRLQLDADTVLSLVRTMSEQAIQQAQRGQQVQFAIPYQFEGTVWVNIEHFGRLAVAVPPVRGTWNLQAQNRTARNTGPWSL
jgi:hypothetical protein